MITMAGSRPLGSQPPLSAIRLKPTCWPVDGRAEDDEVDADQQEGHERHHLDQREPELQLAEHLDRDEVQPEDQDQGGQGAAHCGTSAIGAQYFLKKFMYSATAVMSTIAVMAQFSQYSQPVTNAAFSPKNSRA